MDADEIPSNRHYAGGQTCPDCNTKHCVAHYYCRHCGAPLRRGPDECPSCGAEGDLDGVLANDQLWCPDNDCDVVSFHRGDQA